ncbi:hypothetical protein TNCV_973161 [Trichonephila clavipes]|nr:hypothetical protein TNCV_973161 [Trichonephila clavipes]
MPAQLDIYVYHDHGTSTQQRLSQTSKMSSTYPPPQGMTHSKRVTNPTTAECPPIYMTALDESHLSTPTDWMDRIYTPGNFNISTATSLLESDLETVEAM